MSWDLGDEGWKGHEVVRSVLVVDDDPSVRSLLGFVFEDDGFTVSEAPGGAEALEMLRTDPPACMVLDLMMPEVDGIAVLRTRRDEGLAPDTRVVILTAKTDAADAVWCWELGADEYLNKPVDPDKMLREVLMLLKRTPEEVRARREEGLAEARRLDALEAAFDQRPRRH